MYYNILNKLGNFIGLFLLLILAFSIIHFGQIENLVSSLKQINPPWFVLAIFFQILTYIAQAEIWWLVLHFKEKALPFSSLISLSFSKVFIDHTIPSGGMVGSIAVTNFLLKLDISKEGAILTIAIQVFSKYIAYFGSFLLSIGILWYYDYLSKTLVYLTIIFTIVVLIFLLLTFFLWHKITNKSDGKIPKFLMKYRFVNTFLEFSKTIPRDLIFQTYIMLPSVILQILIFLLDAATLWAIIKGLNTSLTLSGAFITHVISSAIGTISPIPGGLGILDGGAIAILHLFNIQIEVALVAILIYRGITYFLPMIPGAIVTHREAKRLIEK
jgi:glycosyltransferase 2 family protein